MDYIRLRTITEEDFDGIVKEAGGVRIEQEGSADYLLNEAVLELKLVEEEGLEKQTRQAKLARLFRQQQPANPVVIIDPTTLDAASSREYYNIVEGPIQDAVHKAAKQLEVTLPRHSQAAIRVLVILNNGYSALSEDEFKSVCLKCVRNDTRKIDWIIAGGIYYYSDTFDSYLIAPFEAEPINGASNFPSYDALWDSWQKHLEQRMTAHIRAQALPEEGKLPVLDLSFEFDGIRYVKPAPYLGESDFWPPGRRPRTDSTGISNCPAVARTLPRLSEENWHKFKQTMPNQPNLRASYQEWIGFLRQEEGLSLDKLKPLIAVDVQFEEFDNWMTKPKSEWQFSDVCEFSSIVFDKRARDVLFRAKEREKLAIVLPEYIHLVVHEIGQNKSNDMCSIYDVSEVPGHEFRRPVIENEKLFLEYGLAVSSAYAIKLGVDMVLYSIDRTYAWS